MKLSIRQQIEHISSALNPLSPSQLEFVKKTHFNYLTEDVADCKKRRKHFAFFSLYQVCGDWQIDRVFISYFEISNRAKSLQFMGVFEVSQWFFNVKSLKSHIMQRPCTIYGNISFDKPLSFRTSFTYNSAYYAETYGDKIPYSKLHPLVKRTGFSLDMQFSNVKGSKWSFREAIVRAFNSNFYETLIKSKFWYSACLDFSDCQKKALFIAIRHNLSIDDFSLFNDTVRLMEDFGMDWHNPKLLADFHRQHDIALKKKMKMDSFSEFEKIKLAEPDYSSLHGKYLNIAFSNGDLNFHVLQSVSEFYEEGEAMHHCVYKCQYYLKPDTLIFSVRDSKNHRIATIEYDLLSNSILQCRGVCNECPADYDSIVNTFNSNIKYMILNCA